MGFSKRLRRGCNVDGFGPSEARIESNGSHLSPTGLERIGRRRNLRESHGGVTFLEAN